MAAAAECLLERRSRLSSLPAARCVYLPRLLATRSSITTVRSLNKFSSAGRSDGSYNREGVALRHGLPSPPLPSSSNVVKRRRKRKVML